MIENLLWPTKLKTPPYLLVNPKAMFYTATSTADFRAPLINACVLTGSQPTIRFYKNDIDTMHIGLIFDLGKEAESGFKGFIPFMTQEIGSEIVGCQCLGWYNKTIDLTSNPDRIVETDPSKLDPPPNFLDFQSYDFENGEAEPLFVMRGKDLVNWGVLPQFSSAGAYSAIRYALSTNFITNATNGPFLKIWNQFNPNTFPDRMFAIEIILEIQVTANVTPDGFYTGLFSPDVVYPDN